MYWLLEKIKEHECTEMKMKEPGFVLIETSLNPGSDPL